MASKFGNLLGGLFGGKGGEAAAHEVAEAVEYKGYKIRPAARAQGSQWLTAGVISKDFEDGVKEQDFTRADTHPNKEQADDCAIAKGRRIIDEQGDKLFRDD